jgi:ribosomal protein L10
MKKFLKKFVIFIFYEFFLVIFSGKASTFFSTRKPHDIKKVFSDFQKNKQTNNDAITYGNSPSKELKHINN